MRELEGTSVLVTGAAGFIGRNLVDALVARGAQVTAVVRPGGRRLSAVVAGAVDEVAADILDAPGLVDAFRRSRPALVVHAAMAGGHPDAPAQVAHAHAVSVDGTANVLDASSRAAVTRIVHVGSSLEYGHRSEPLREDLALEPTTPRGEAKAAAAALCLRAAQAGAPVTVLRPFSVYGPWEPATRLVPTAIRAALHGHALPLTEPGLRRDFVHVDDVTRAVVLALTAGAEIEGRAYNVGTGRETTNEELVATVGAVVHRPVTVRVGAYPRRPVDAPSWVADTARARRELGFEAAIDLRDGIAATVAWTRAHGAAAA